MKRNHWRAFLAKANNALSFKAFKYTSTQTSSLISPLYRRDRSLATDKNKQAELLFKGTSVVQNYCDTSDVTMTQPQTPALTHPDITAHEVDEVLKKIPSGRATGNNEIPNEILKLAKPLLLPHLVTVFNECLKHGYFPRKWRTATTAILRKNDKEDYSEPGAYRPIALLSCLGKILETLLTRRMAHWAETNHVIAHGHMGGR